MKKASFVLFCFVLFLFVQAGSAFAENRLNETVNDLLGTSYKWGGQTEKGFDCSGFTKFVFSKFGIDLNHQSKAQAAEGNWVSKDDLRPGDLVFFNTDGRGISHVGIYLGDSKFVHSATNQGVVINDVNETYYKKRYVTARRVLWDEIYTQLTTETPSQDDNAS